jgi:hypothetical protein
MFEKRLLIFSLRLIFICSFLAPIMSGASEEPPLYCGIDRGAWCMISGAYEVNIRPIQDSSIIRWEIFDDYWRGEPAIVLESKYCREGAADTIEVAPMDRDYLFEGVRWHKVGVKLRQDGRCELSFLFPRQSKLRMAEALIASKVAVCLNGSPCALNIIGPHLRPQLVESAQDQ